MKYDDHKGVLLCLVRECKVWNDAKRVAAGRGFVQREYYRGERFVDLLKKMRRRMSAIWCVLCDQNV